MKFVIDSREQKPYTKYLDTLGHTYKIRKLAVGDYSILGYEQKFSIERKELNDLIGSLTQGRRRFKALLTRAAKLDYFALVIEGSFYDIQNRNYRSKAHPSSILSTIFMWSVEFGIPIFFVDSRNGGAFAVIKLAEAFLRHKGA